MPHATHRYDFEHKVVTWAAQTSRQLTGALNGFVLLLTPGGLPQALHCEPGVADLAATHGAIEARGDPHLLYDPLDDGREFIWLSWRDVARPAMERLIGPPFSAADFVGRRDGSRVAYPETWGVMF